MCISTKASPFKASRAVSSVLMQMCSYAWMPSLCTGCRLLVCFLILCSAGWHAVLWDCMHVYLYTIECSSVRPDAALCITFTRMRSLARTFAHACSHRTFTRMHAFTCTHVCTRMCMTHGTHVYTHTCIYMCVCSNQVFGTLRLPLPSLGPKHSSECMVQMVFNLFFGLFASLDRLSVPTAEGPLPLQKYEPMWKHSGGKLMGPIPLTQNSTARFSFDFFWFVFLFCLCIWFQFLVD